jgi:hypothetical protein
MASYWVLKWYNISWIHLIFFLNNFIWTKPVLRFMSQNFILIIDYRCVVYSACKTNWQMVQRSILYIKKLKNQKKNCNSITKYKNAKMWYTSCFYKALYTKYTFHTNYMQLNPSSITYIVYWLPWYTFFIIK